MSNLKSTMMVFIDDYACVAKFATFNEKTSALNIDESIPPVVFSSQVLLSALQGFGVSFPLCDVSDQLHDLPPQLGFGADAASEELKHYGLAEILELASEDEETKRLVPELYFALLIKSCLDLGAKNTWIHNLCISVPLLCDDQQSVLVRVLERLCGLFAFDSLRLFDTYQAIFMGSSLQRWLHIKNHLGTFVVWRNGVSGRLWVNDWEFNKWIITRTQRDPQKMCPILFLQCPEAVRFTVSADSILMELDSAIRKSEDSQKVRCRLDSKTHRLSFYNRTTWDLMKQQFSPVDMQLQRRGFEHCRQQVVEKIGIVGSLLCQSNINRFIERGLKDALCNTREPEREIFSCVDVIFSGIKAIGINQGLPIAGSPWRLVGARTSDGTVVRIEDGREAVELTSPVAADSNARKSPLEFDLLYHVPRSDGEEVAAKVKLPLDRYDNDDTYLLEPFPPEGGKSGLLIRVGSRPVALQAESDGVELKLEVGRGYEVTFSDQHRAELTIQKRLSQFLTNGTYFFGSDVKRGK